MTWRRCCSLLASVLLVLGLAACGDDDDDDTAASADHAEGEHDMGDESMNPCADGVSPEEAGLPPSEEPAAGATEISVTARDYEFVGTDAIADAGSYAITLDNEGVELHEMVIQRIDESETRTVEELLQSEAPPETLTEVAFGFACPGSSTTFNADMSEPGRYVALCFIPTGTTPETDPAALESSEGAPHAVNGMIVELELA